VTSLSDRDSSVRLTAVRSLAKIRAGQALSALVSALKDPEPAVREAAVNGIKAFADVRTVPYLRPMLKDPDSVVRAATARTLLGIGWAPADEQEEVRVLVAQGDYKLAVQHGEVAFEALMDVLRDRSQISRRNAVEALAMLEDDRVPRVLRDCLTDPDTQVRVAAAEELAKHPGKESVEALALALNDCEPLLRAAAACSLGRLEDRTAVPSLVQALQDSHWSVRKAAVDTLGRLAAVEAATPLGAALKDPDADVREAAVIALGQIGDQCAVEWLVASLADPASTVRHAAAAVLNSLDPEWDHSDGARRAVTVLEPLLQAREYWVRHAASAVVTRLRGERPDPRQLRPGPQESSSRRIKVLQTLIGAVEDFDRDIRLAAVEALGRLEDLSCAGHLRSLLNDPDEWVQMAAGKALQQVMQHKTSAPAGALRMLH
jgi:HEAT repeat protein